MNYIHAFLFRLEVKIFIHYKAQFSSLSLLKML